MSCILNTRKSWGRMERRMVSGWWRLIVWGKLHKRRSGSDLRIMIWFNGSFMISDRIRCSRVLRLVSLRFSCHHKRATDDWDITNDFSGRMEGLHDDHTSIVRLCCLLWGEKRSWHLDVDSCTSHTVQFSDDNKRKWVRNQCYGTTQWATIRKKKRKNIWEYRFFTHSSVSKEQWWRCWCSGLRLVNKVREIF